MKSKAASLIEVFSNCWCNKILKLIHVEIKGVALRRRKAPAPHGRHLEQGYDDRTQELRVVFANRTGGVPVNDHILRVGLNYKFGWDSPVVARY